MCVSEHVYVCVPSECVLHGRFLHQRSDAFSISMSRGRYQSNVLDAQVKSMLSHVTSNTETHSQLSSATPISASYQKHICLHKVQVKIFL